MYVIWCAISASGSPPGKEKPSRLRLLSDRSSGFLARGFFRPAAATEFDYSSTQAVRTLREEDRVILVNSNPA
jgi:hypothetical protein